MSVSIRNRLPGTIEEIVSDKVVSEVVIRTAGRNRDADYYNRFSEANDLKKGDNVFAVMKATAVSVEKE